MLIVLDTNEFIFGIEETSKPSVELLDLLVDFPESYVLRIARSIFSEVRRNLAPEDFRTFVLLIESLTTINEDFEVPYELARAYENQGLKPGDAFIAAYTEHVGARYLISENRHFLSRRSNLPFHVATAANFMQEIGRRRR